MHSILGFKLGKKIYARVTYYLVVCFNFKVHQMLFENPSASETYTGKIPEIACFEASMNLLSRRSNIIPRKSHKEYLSSDIVH